MYDDERFDRVRRLVSDYVRSPSLRHLRDPHSLTKLAREIVTAVDRRSGVWRKWEGARTSLIKAAAPSWIPLEDLQAYLNDIPGPKLTATDVAQRLRSIQDEYQYWPDERLKEGCLALYEDERAQGTELPAILGLLKDFMEEEGERLRLEAIAAYSRKKEEERLAKQQRFLSGADCRWTAIDTSGQVYCRVNGRAYRLSPTKDARWDRYRIAGVDGGKVEMLGRYLQRKDATKAVAEMAYKPEYGWG